MKFEKNDVYEYNSLHFCYNTPIFMLSNYIIPYFSHETAASLNKSIVKIIITSLMK